MLFLGDVIMRMISRSPEDSKGKAILALIAGLIILIVVKFIPFLGVWLEFIALLFGLGALSIKTYRTYVGENTSA